LLVGGEDVFKSHASHRIFDGHQFQVADTLLDALASLESGAIDLILLSCEFREEELSLFAFEAHRRGFAGLTLRVAPIPSEVTSTRPTGDRELSGWRFGQQSWEGETQEKSVSGSGKRYQVSAQRVAQGVQTGPKVNGPHDSISFTTKEQAVLTRVSEGWTNQQMAHDLKCSEGSVKAILQQLFSKLGVRKRAQIVRMAFEKTLMPLQEGHRPKSALRG
jgi:DNA-binding CsgD family transcriptional regulator